MPGPDDDADDRRVIARGYDFPKFSEDVKVDPNTGARGENPKPTFPADPESLVAREGDDQ